jgi:hypothetical protein
MTEINQEQSDSQANGSKVGSEAIKWSAIVIIVAAVLWFLAKYVIPLIG